jgi:carbonic anhydrase/acetyltransferase-like protein (isoleucine patch superfamily)
MALSSQNPPVWCVVVNKDTWECSDVKDWHRHENGGGWVYKNAFVAPTAFVDYSSVVSYNAKVLDSAGVHGYCHIKDNAIVCGNAVVSGGASISDNAVVSGSAHVCGDSIVKDSAFVGGDAVLDCTACVSDYQTILTGKLSTALPKSKKPLYPWDEMKDTPNQYISLGEFLNSFGGLSSNPYARDRKEVKLNTDPELAANFEPRTQKAKGIHALSVRGHMARDIRFQKIETANPDRMVGQFVRPCPMRPRHGFVDSRMVNNLAEANTIIEETKKADPEAEFIVMPFVQSSYSGIFTPGLLSVGLGHDGATAGTSSISLPAIGNYPRINRAEEPKMFTNAGIKEAEYIELLWEKRDELNHPQAVQLRDGPKVSQDADYIPKKTKVKKVIMAEGDLLEWESKMKEVPAGTVVYHPNGSLASHYAIHGVLNQIPVVISFEPKVGEVLEAKTETKPISLDALRAGFVYGQRIQFSKRIEPEYEDYSTAAKVMLAALHHISVWSGRYDFLIGLGMGLAYRLTVVATLGEYRHNRRANEGGSKDRDRVYSEYWNESEKGDTSIRMADALRSFNCDHWPSNYGGTAWFTFAKHATDMLNHLIDGKITESLEAFNRCVNAAHNNGWAFNKFCSQDVMSATAMNPVYALLYAATTLHRVITTESSKELFDAYLEEFNALEKYPTNFIKTPERVGSDDDDDYDEEEDSEEESNTDSDDYENFKVQEAVAQLQFKPVGNSRVHVQYRTVSKVGLKGYGTVDIPNPYGVTRTEIKTEGTDKITSGEATMSPSMAGSETPYYSVKITDGKFEEWENVNLSGFKTTNYEIF